MKLHDMTIEQFMKFNLITEMYKSDESKWEKEVITLFHGTDKVEKIDADETMSYITVLLQEPTELVHRFKYQGVEYGFIPNLDKITTAEYIDLRTYMQEGTQMHKIASILFRPIKKKAGKLYQIEDYDGTTNAETMKGVSFKVALGGLSFFFTLAKSLKVSLGQGSISSQTEKTQSQTETT